MYFLKLSIVQDLIDRGWRRSGQYCYKPTMNRTCCPLYTIKCDVMHFKPTKSQKKVVKKFVNYILNDVKPGGGRENSRSESEDADDNTAACDNIQERTEHLENNLKLKDIDMIDAKNDVEIDSGDPAKAECREENNDSKKTVETVTNCDKETLENTSKKFKHPMGMDPSKPKQGKAKVRRIEKWKSKNGNNPEKVNDKNQEKTIEDLLQPLESSSGSKHKWEIRLVPATETNSTFSSTLKETVKVYQKYQQVIHNDTPDKCTEKQFKRFLCNSPLQMDRSGPPHGSYHYQYCIDGNIMAVGVLDILPHCVSSVYLYYDPKYTFLSPGTLTSLLEITLVRKLAKTYPAINEYYLGFYIHNCVKMKYKGRYAPSALLCPETYTWHPLPSCIDLLDKSAYSRLDPDPNRVDKDLVVDMTQLGVLYCRQATSYAFYQSILEDDGEDKDRDKEEVVEYSSLVGNTLAKRMLLYRPA